MTNIQSQSLSGAAAVGKVGAATKRSSSAAASSVMGKLSGRVAGSVGRALRLVEEDRGERQQGGQRDDPYEIEAMVEELSREIPGNTLAVGLVSRSLHEFAHEVAALIMARPQSSSLSFLERLIAEQGATKGEANMSELATIIEKTTAKLQAN
jgi:hypothetical protein